MLSLHAAGPVAGDFTSFVETICAHDGVELLGISHTATHAAEALKAYKIDALIFPFDWADVVRTLKVSIGTSRPVPALVVVADQLSTPVLARSLACGFAGAVETAAHVDKAIDRIADVVRGSWNLANEPSLSGLALSPGLLARELMVSNADDQHVADLVGSGLTDDEIAVAMGWTLQKVRNCVEHLLSTNDLTYRTQLAVIRASLLKVPDFS